MNRQSPFAACRHLFSPLWTRILWTSAFWVTGAVAALLLSMDPTGLTSPTVQAASATDCDASPSEDAYRPADWFLYFADEFNCAEVPDHWSIQGPMSKAAYQPPQNGYVQVKNGALQVGVVDVDVSFPYLYLVDDSATSYDIPFTSRRIDWLPNTGDFRLAMRVRFQAEFSGDHRISIYADGHKPSYAGPLFYIGSDYNKSVEAWRGLIVGADRGRQFVDLDDHGYPNPYAEWVVMTVDHRQSQDRFEIAVDGVPMLTTTLSSFKEQAIAAVRPDVLYLGSLAYLESAVGWIDIELDWLRIYAPPSTVQATEGILQATFEATPMPQDAPSSYTGLLPAGPFANTPYWHEDFDGGDSAMPDYWRLLADNDPDSTDTVVSHSHATISNNGTARAVPVWGIYDDLRLYVETPTGAESAYLAERAQSNTAHTAPLLPATEGASATKDPAYVDWRPNRGNIRYAWKARQSASGYGVEVSNGGHVPYFTGAMFYTLLDTTHGTGGQFIFPSCQEKYFWRLHLLPEYAALGDMETIVTADYINGTVFLYVDGQLIGWWPESDCSLNWYLRGENATSPDLLFFGNPAIEAPGRWSEVGVDWFATFAGVDTPPMIEGWLPYTDEIFFDWNAVDDADEVDVMTRTVTLTSTEPLHWQAHIHDQFEWLGVTPISGTTRLTSTGTLELPPLVAYLTLTATRPVTYADDSTVLILNAETISGSQVAPFAVPITSVYSRPADTYQQFLPHVIGSTDARRR